MTTTLLEHRKPRMLATVTGISLYREKSTVRRFGFSSDQEDETLLEVRSNRVSLTLKSGETTETVVVRGQNIPITLRMTALISESFQRNPTLFLGHRASSVAWDDLWLKRLSSYERQYMPESWVSIHHRGQTIYTTNPSPQIEALERLAEGTEINDTLIRSATSDMIHSGEDVITEHDSQTAVVFTPFKDYLRAAVLERRFGKTGSFAVSAFHPPKPEKPVRYSSFILLCADLIEAMNLRLYLDRVSQAIDENRFYGSGIAPDQVAAAQARKRDLVEFVSAFERANRVAYRPERPQI